MMDDMQMHGDLLADTLNRLATINRQLGGNRVTLSAVKELLFGRSNEKEICIIDLGCGNGDILRRIADWGRKNSFTLRLIGLDLNAFTISHAEHQSSGYAEISYRVMDVHSEEMAEIDYDIALATLFIHHLPTSNIETLMSRLASAARIGIVINDLHRHWLAYRLFQLYSLTIRNKMIRHDGLVSILRAFKRSDLAMIDEKLNLNGDIRWKWAFRYQWIIKNRCQ